MGLAENFKKFLNSEEGQQAMQEFGEKLHKESLFKERWLNKFIVNLESKDDKDLELLLQPFYKHEKKRKEILYKQGFDSQSSLYSTLYEVFEKLGTEANDEEYGVFTSAIFYWRGYRMELICGQGSFYSLSKI